MRNKKRFAGILLVLVLLLTGTGCSTKRTYGEVSGFSYTVPSPSPESSRKELGRGEGFSGQLEKSSFPEASLEVSAEKPASTPEKSDTPTCRNLQEVRDLLWNTLENGKSERSFLYTGDLDEITPELICRMTGAVYCTVWKGTQDPQRVDIQLTEYPGVRMVKAYQSGTVSSLRAEEQQALNMALQVVSQAKAQAKTDLMLELALHDWLCEHITYDESSTLVTDPEKIPRHLTAIGAILDGSANCQGYTDGFYLLASLAGFRVGMQNCLAESGEGHIFNVIEINDIWSVVDVTFDDNSISLDGEILADAHLFNAGMDIAGQEYSWPATYDRYPITKTTTSSYYYYTQEDSLYQCYGRAYSNLSDMAADIVNQWTTYGRTEMDLMLCGQKATWSGLDQYLSEEARATGRDYSYQIIAVQKGNNTFFKVRFQ